MLILVLAVPSLLFLPAVILYALFPVPVAAAWRRAHRVRPRPRSAVEHDTAPPPTDDVAAAGLRGPPVPGETCDRCAAAAAAAVYLPSGRLLLCGHHGRQHEAALQVRGAVIVGQLSFPPQRRAPSVQRSA